MRTEFDCLSKEYVAAPITELTGIDVTLDVVQVALTSTRSSVGAVWITGNWVMIGGRACAEGLYGPGAPGGAVAPGRYWFKAKVTDNPEIPILTSPNQVTFF
jgi:hypothetical protein